MSNTNSNTVPDNLKKLEALYEKLERDPNLEKAFLEDKIGFLNMSDLIANCLEKITFVSEPSLEDYVATNKATRLLANKLL